MKIIPKFQGGNSFDRPSIYEFINWNKDWLARDKSGNPMLSPTPSSMPFPYNYNSLDYQKNRGQYNFNRGLNWTYEDDTDWYKKFNKEYLYHNDQLLENGKEWFRQYLTNSGDDIKWKNTIQDFIKSNFTKWDSNTDIGGQKFKSAIDFLKYYTNDRKPGQAHNTNTGYTYFDPETGGLYKNIPEGYIEGNKNEYSNQIIGLQNMHKTGNIVDFIPIIKNQNINPQNNEAYNYLKETWESNRDKYSTDNGYNPKTQSGGSVVKGTPGWVRGIGKLFGNIGKGIGGLFKGNGEPMNPAWAQGLRTLMDNAFNTRNTEELIDKMDVPLSNYTPVYRQVHGDYIAQQQAQREASRLRTSQPITANQQIQSATDLEGIQRGNQLIEQGNAKDAQMFWNTSEQAFQQAKENARGWDVTANQNRQKLSEFNNKIAELRFNTRKQNMQNWDTFFSDMEKRAWQKYDRNQAKEILAQEELDDLWDTRSGSGTDYNELKEIQRRIEEETDKGTGADKAVLRQLYKQAGTIQERITARTAYNKLKRLGIYDKVKFNEMYPNYDFDSEGNREYRSFINPSYRRWGSFFQQGGAFGVAAASSAGSANPYLAAADKGSSSTSTSSSSRSSSKDDDEKTKDRLLTNIAETIKGIDGLNSDVSRLYDELTAFFDVQRYSLKGLNDDPMQFYSMYIRALNRVNQVKQSAKQFDSAYKELEKRNAITSPAIDANGYVFVGVDGTDKVDRITPKEYLDNPEKYKLLRNNQLLDLRRNNPSFAFNDKYITEVAYNGTNIQDIHKFVKDVISKIGSDKETKDLLVRQYGNNAVQGLQKLSQLVQNGGVDPEAAQIIAGLTGALTEYNVTTENSIRQAELALKTVVAMLPANMKSFLVLHSGGAENVEKLLASLIFQGLDTISDFKINNITMLDEMGMPKSGSTKGSGSSGSGEDKGEPKTTTATKWAQGHGNKSTFSIVGGNNTSWTVSGNTLGITDNSDKSLGQCTMADLKAGWGSALDIQHAYMGNNRLSALAQSQIVLEDGDITYVALPVDQSVSYPKPAFSRLKNLSKADAELRNMGIDITERENLTPDKKAKVNEVYKKYELDPFFDENGAVNKLKFAYFGLIKGIVNEDAFENKDLVRDFLITASDQERKLYEDILKSNPRTKDFSISNGVPIFGWGADEVYRGTIFIPVRTNIFNTQSGYGSSYAGTGEVDIRTETRQQRHDAEQAQGGVHPERVKQTNFQSLQ